MTNSSNEADGNLAAQPRLFFHRHRSHPPARLVFRVGRPIGRDGFARSSTIMVLVLACFTACVVVSTSYTARDTRPAPPALQTFAPSPRAPVPVASSRNRFKEPEPIVRVNVTPGGLDSFQLEVRGAYYWKSLERHNKLPAKPDLGRVTVASTMSGLKLGSLQLSTNQLEIEPAQSPSIVVNGHLYRGRIRLFRRTDGKVSAVNVLAIEEYLASVVDSEMPAKFPDAARQAQAIVARTYALYQIQQSEPDAVFDLLSSQRSQKYLGVEYLDSNKRRLAGESQSSRQAVKGTRGVVCQANGKLFCTYYSAVCGGRTTNGKELFKDAADATQSVPCEWCKESPLYRWKADLPRDEFEQRALLASERSNTTRIRSIRQLAEPGSGSISRFELDDGLKPRLVTGTELRERLPTGMLLSPHFRITLESHRVTIEGQGHGHGVGFCQWGAKGQAEAGRDSHDIVRHYYPGAELETKNY